MSIYRSRKKNGCARTCANKDKTAKNSVDYMYSPCPLYRNLLGKPGNGSSGHVFGSQLAKRLVRVQTDKSVISYSAVFSVVTQRSSPERALRDDTKNGCLSD